MTGVKSILGERVHLEIARGTGLANVLYCSKTRPEDDVANASFFKFGTLGRKGQRNDLNKVKDMIRGGASEQEIADEHFGSWVRYRQAFREYRTLINQVITKPAYEMSSFPESWQGITHQDKCMILWGSPGIGKTHFAIALLGPCLMVSHIDELSNFNPEVHKGIVFDDMSFHHMPIGAQIHLVDWKFDRSVHIRYGLANIPKHTKKIFTTNAIGGGIFNLDPSLGIKRRVKIRHLELLQ